jgi:hypothetical protein
MTVHGENLGGVVGIVDAVTVGDNGQRKSAGYETGTSVKTMVATNSGEGDAE